MPESWSKPATRQFCIAGTKAVAMETKNTQLTTPTISSLAWNLASLSMAMPSLPATTTLATKQ